MSYLSINYLEKNFKERNILNNISLDIDKGSFIILLGPSGCGKSTLLRCIAGLESIDRGEICLDGMNITNTKPAQRNIGMIFQQYGLFPTKTVYGNIAFGLKVRKTPNHIIKKEVYELLELVDLTSLANKYPSQLSGGEQQRVALARSLIVKPKVVLFDEPLSAIDAKLRKDLQINIKAIHEKLNMTSIFVTHDQQEAMLMGDVVYLMNNGKIEQFGTPKDLYHNPKTLFVAQFIGDHNILNKEDCQKIFNHKIAHNHLVICPEHIFINTEYRTMGKAKVIDIMFLGNYECVVLDYHGIILKCHVVGKSNESLKRGCLVDFYIDFDRCAILD